MIATQRGIGAVATPVYMSVYNSRGVTVNRYGAAKGALLTLVSMVFAAGCASSSSRVAPAETLFASQTSEIVAIAEHGGELFVARSAAEGCVLESVDRSSIESGPRVIRKLEICPERIDFSDDGTSVLLGPRGALDASGLDEGVRYVTTSGNQMARATGDRIEWKRAAGETVDSRVISNRLEIVDGGEALIAVASADGGDSVVRLEWDEEESALVSTTLTTEPVEKIEELVLDEEEKELAISARRNGSKDIAIVNAEEPVMNWVPEDPADEVKPR
ncbi:MAG: hypothetical protein R3338_13675, partial [Thermoanaerobaculia bacterium]|nr:hypothetical protein [Thermoanaerobaculia bacterium]